MASYVSASTHRPSGLVARVRDSQLPPVEERRRIRLASRATLREFAAELGVSPMTVLRWEQGKVEPRLTHRVAYGQLLRALAEVSS